MELAGQPMQIQNRIYGIDFSGAQDGGNKIWIAKGITEGKTLLIEDYKNTLILEFLKSLPGRSVYQS